jgi:hypothetical protein
MAVSEGPEAGLLGGANLGWSDQPILRQPAKEQGRGALRTTVTQNLICARRGGFVGIWVDKVRRQWDHAIAVTRNKWTGLQAE